MWRYVKEAFWARVQTPLAGALPMNALAVLGVGIFGVAEHALWLIGAGLETAYLYALATNPRFQNVINARSLESSRRTVAQTHSQLLAQLTPEGRARTEMLKARIDQTMTVYRSSGSDNLLLDSSLEALQKLGDLHLRLLVAERNLEKAGAQTDEAALARQSAALERELAAANQLSPSLRESKQATLELTQKRLTNARRRDQSRVEIASDLARIEAQVDLALEEAGLEGKPPEVTGNLRLLNQILESNTALGNSETGADGALEEF